MRKMDFRIIFLIVFFGSALVILLSAILVLSLKEKTRSKSLLKKYQDIGFRPGSKDIVESKGFKETRMGNRQKIYNVFTGTFQRIRTIIFDMDTSVGNLGYGTGTPHGNTYKSSGIIFEKRAPVFLLRPKSPISRKVYNEYFSLEGDSSFMTESLAQTIQKRYTIESTGDHILFVPSKRRIENIRKELEDTYKLLEEITERNQ